MSPTLDPGACAGDAAGVPAAKTIVFGLLKREDRVYTAIVPNASKAALQAVIRGRAQPELIVHTDGWAGYHGLVDLGHDKHLRVEYRNNIFARVQPHQQNRELRQTMHRKVLRRA